jgi:hypothetical protein
MLYDSRLTGDWQNRRDPGSISVRVLQPLLGGCDGTQHSKTRQEIEKKNHRIPYHTPRLISPSDVSVDIQFIKRVAGLRLSA